VWDDEGRRYLDFVGGWAVTNLGHCHPAVVAAVQHQVQTLMIASNDVYTIPQIELAEELVRQSCLHRVFFANSGAEANEGAVKLARKWGKLHRGDAFEVITTDHSFHGRTLAMTAATGKPAARVSFEPMPTGFVNVAYNDIDALRRATSAKTVAVMLEPVQGEGGVHVPARDYLTQVRAWCDERNLLLILDEVQTGFGRLGTLFGYQHFGVEPDVMTLSKGLGGGVPVAAILAKDRACVFTPGDHGTTFGGNPLVCAAALASVKAIVADDVSANARDVGAYFKARLEGLQTKHPGLIKAVRGLGLLVALQLAQHKAIDIALECLDRGLLVNALPAADDTLRFMPALIVCREDVDEAVGILERVLTS
jgi:predicted acetylornithine/succinylornithine family transaminase